MILVGKLRQAILKRTGGAGPGLQLSPVSSMLSFWGLMRAYWFSDRWKEAWTLTVAIALLTALSSKSGVWFAEASGSLVNAIATFHDPGTKAPVEALFSNAGTLLLIVILKDAGFTGVRDLVSTTLHRKWRDWLNSRFNEALLDDNHTHFHVQHGSSESGEVPDNIDQRVQESIKGMTGGAIGLAMGVMAVTSSLFFVGQKLLQTSSPVEGLAFLGAYGSAVLAFVAVAIYVPLNTWIAVKLGGLLEKLNVALQQAEGGYRAELTTLLRRSFNVAAARGEEVQKSMHERLYSDIDHTWSRINVVNATYLSFLHIYSFVGDRLVAYGPGLVPFIAGRIDLKSYVTGAELVASLIHQCSWFIQVMPAIATLRANSRRVLDVAEAIEKVQMPREFYQRTGHSDFRHLSQDAKFGLTVRDLELSHSGFDQSPFLRSAHLQFKRGEWTYVKGESGCGKTSLIRAINGLWPHGSGAIVAPRGVDAFYASQEIKLPSVSLKALVCLPERPDGHGDARVAWALAEAGLGEFAGDLHEEGREGKAWDQMLSGGQKQKLVAARILLHQPGLLFLDEATGALDPEGRVAFHQAIKDNCPDITVISVMHEQATPKSATGEEFYDSVLTIEGGRTTKKPIVPPLPAEIISVLQGGEAAEAGRRGYSRVRQ